MLLTFSTWPEIEAALARSPTALIPIGSTEQHGPTGLLGTDWLCPEIIAHQAQKISPDWLVTPACNIGMSQHHLGFPGTISLRPLTFIAVLRDWVHSLTAHGFKKLYFLNGHGGNVASIEAAFTELYAEASFAHGRSDFVCKLQNWWELPGVEALAKRLFPTGHGTHATPSEIAITQWAYPDTRKVAACEPEIAAMFPIRDAAEYRARHPDGRRGSNALQATPAAGGELVALAAQGVLDSIAAFSRTPL